ncbi:MAG: septal ring lytic transglycosylase RlpA family protein [Bacteroidetes bacterium]|nr:MAG: septal ring lytic transglycosylase RlpA family protein [Bacteroidota bacterium]
MRIQINYKICIVFCFVLMLFGVFAQNAHFSAPLSMASANNFPQDTLPQKDTAAVVKKFTQKGLASYYGNKFHGRRTASGERYSKNKLTAAHRTLPFGAMVKVTEVKTGKWLVVRINDRGPHVRRRIIDLSYAAAKQFGMIKGAGVIKVKIQVVEWPANPENN